MNLLDVVSLLSVAAVVVTLPPAVENWEDAMQDATLFERSDEDRSGIAVRRVRRSFSELLVMILLGLLGLSRFLMFDTFSVWERTIYTYIVTALYMLTLGVVLFGQWSRWLVEGGMRRRQALLDARDAAAYRARAGRRRPARNGERNATLDVESGSLPPTEPPAGENGDES